MREIRNVPVAGPSITELEISYVNEAIRTNWYDKAGDFVDRFERSFAKHCGRRYAISLPSCTSGLHLSLMALGVGPGDDVIVPDVTWIASAAPIHYVGANPIFADFDPHTWCLSAETVKAALTPKTKAVIVVNLYGHMPNWDELQALSEKHGFALIEDSAESVGSTFNGRPSGSFGLTSCFSFHGSKTLTTGEGGMVLTDDESLWKRMMIARDHGRNPGDTMFRNKEIGYKYKMSSLQAALGLAQLERVDELVAKKRQIFHWYQEHFRADVDLELNPESAGLYNSYWMSTLLLPRSSPQDKDWMISRLKSVGIQTRPFFDPLTKLDAYANSSDRNRAREKNVVSAEISRRGLNLPSALSLTEDDIIYVAQNVREQLRGTVIA